MATHSSVLAWRILWTEEPGAAVHGVTQSTTQLKHLSMHACIGEGNGNPLQYSCLENPRDRGAWWAAVYGVAQSRTQLKRLRSSSSSILYTFLSIFIYLFIFHLYFFYLTMYLGESKIQIAVRGLYHGKW